jgi:flagellar basal-body rod protein FlgF
MYAAVSGSLAAQQRLDVIANNLANASTPGFKAELLVQRADEIGTRTGNVNATPTAITRGTLQTNFANGPIERTGNPLDVALSGSGFLVVDGPHGERLTRRGNLAIDGDGVLTTSDGLRVQGQGGGELRVGGGPVTIDDKGVVKVGDAAIGALRVVDVNDPQTLLRESGTTFAPGREAPHELDPGATQVVQSALEGANLSPVQSLVALIDTMRGFEAYLHAADRLDQMTAHAITDVGRA